MVRAAVVAAILCTVLSACATSRVAQPASGIESSVARFRADLSNFQQAFGYLQNGEQDRIAFVLQNFLYRVADVGFVIHHKDIGAQFLCPPLLLAKV